MSQAIVQRAREKLRSAMGDEAVLRLNLTGDLRFVAQVLQELKPVLEKADMLMFSSPTSSVLWEVRKAAYEIMDMVDELQEARSPAAATEQLNDDVNDSMEQLNASHTLGLKDIAMSVPYTEEMTRNVEMVEEVEEVGRPDTNTLKNWSRSCTYKAEEDEALCEA